MNGAESLLSTLVKCGVEVCFANPGTSEMHLVQAIDGNDTIRPVLALFEGVCTGAADGYGRMLGKPATTLLHLGPGLANGIANLHNARRAGSPIINLIGNHASYHLQYDAPLTSNIDVLAENVSAWVKSDSSAATLASDGAAAYAATLSPTTGSTGHIATMIIPAEAAWGEAKSAAEPNPLPSRARVADKGISKVAEEIGEGDIILLDSTGLSQAGLIAANRIAAKTGCTVYGSLFSARIDGGPGLPSFKRLPYFPEQVMETLKGTRRIILAGGEAPVSFFAYPNTPSLLVPSDCELVRLAKPEEDVVDALESLADLVNAPRDDYAKNKLNKPELPTGKLSVMSSALVIANLLPENAIICGDSGGGGAAFDPCQRAARHSWLNITGGSIGQGGPAAVGAAIACPDRRVLALLGDGAAMYTIQSLWTQARESLNVTTVIFSNRKYGILDTEYRRLGVNTVGERAASLFDLGNPNIDFVQLANGMGVPGTVANTAEEFAAAFAQSLVLDGPFLIEARVG